jgi:hypothetical protein
MSDSSKPTGFLDRLKHWWEPAVLFIGAVTAVVQFLKLWRGDRDTLGAMACAVSGAYLGVEAIPQAWREKIENGQHIEGLAIKLAEMRGRKDPGHVPS